MRPLVPCPAACFHFGMDISQRLKAAREREGLTQQQVADAAGLSQGLIANVEAGRRRSARARLAIAEAVGITVTAKELVSR